ncbi:glycosyl transferase [Pectobacterium carotovorum]|nr:glycosyl transferase [Pectobacterium carotovorum]
MSVAGIDCNKTIIYDGLVSIIMPVYNAERYLKHSVDSVLNQTYDNFELIIINDASTDSVKEIITGFNDARIKYIENENNVGVAESRNRGINKAVGEYLAFLDADDYWLPTKLEFQIGTMKKNGAFCCHSAYERMNSDFSSVLGTVKAKEYVSFNDMLKSNFIGNLTGIYNVKHNGKCYQKKVGHEDYLMWLHVTKKCSSVGINHVLARYRVSDNGVSSNKIKAMTWHYNILRNELKISFSKSCFLFFMYAVNAIIKRK